MNAVVLFFPSGSHEIVSVPLQIVEGMVDARNLLEVVSWRLGPKTVYPNTLTGRQRWVKEAVGGLP